MSKRGADFQMSKDGAFNGDGSESSDHNGAAIRASSAQLAKRKILSARRPGGGSSRSATKPSVPAQPQSSIFGASSSLDTSRANSGLTQSSNEGSTMNSNPNNPSNLFTFGQNSTNSPIPLSFGGGSSSANHASSLFGFSSSVATSTTPTFNFGTSERDMASTPPATSSFIFQASPNFSFAPSKNSAQDVGGYTGNMFTIPSTATSRQVTQNLGLSSDPMNTQSDGNLVGANSFSLQHQGAANLFSKNDKDPEASTNQSLFSASNTFSIQNSAPASQSNDFNQSEGALGSFPTKPHSNLFGSDGNAGTQLSPFSAKQEAQNKVSSPAASPFGAFKPVSETFGSTKTNPLGVLSKSPAGALSTDSAPKNLFDFSENQATTAAPFFSSPSASVDAAVQSGSSNTSAITKSLIPANSNIFQPQNDTRKAASDQDTNVSASTIPTTSSIGPGFGNEMFSEGPGPRSNQSNLRSFSTHGPGLAASLFENPNPSILSTQSTSATSIFSSQSSAFHGFVPSVLNKSGEPKETNINVKPIFQNSEGAVSQASSYTTGSKSTRNSILGESNNKGPLNPPILESYSPMATSGSSASINLTLAQTGIDVNELKALRAECVSIMPQIPDNLSGSQRDEFVFAYRMMCLEKGLRNFVANQLGNNADMKHISRYYDTARSIIFQAAGAKRKAESVDSETVEVSNKRQNIRGLASGSGDRASTQTEISAADNEDLGSNRSPAPNASSISDSAQTNSSSSSSSSNALSKTSQIFANLTKPNDTVQFLGSHNRIDTCSTDGTSQAIEANLFSPNPLKSKTTNDSPFSFSAQTGSIMSVQKDSDKSNTSLDMERKQRANEEGLITEEWQPRHRNKLNAKRSMHALSDSSEFSVGPVTRSLDQFSENADENKKAKGRRKMSTDGSDEDGAEQQHQTEEKHELATKSSGMKLKVPGASPVFSGTSTASGFSANGPISRTPTPSLFENLGRADSDAEGSKIGDADNEESECSDEEENATSATPSAPLATASLFDRIAKDEDSNLVKENVGTFEPTRPDQLDRTRDKDDGHEVNNTAGDHTWKPDSPIRFSTTVSAPSLNVISPSPSKHGSNILPTSKPFGSLFGTSQINQNSDSIFAYSNANKNVRPATASGFSFGSQPKPIIAGTLTPNTILESSNTSRGTSPGMTTAEESTGEGGDDPLPQDPQLDLSDSHAGEENENILFSVKAKGMELDSPNPGEDREWITRGVGDFRLLQHRTTRKCRMILRAGPTSKVVLNTSLQPDIKYGIEGGKNLQFLAPKKVGVTKWNIRVKTEEDGRRLLQLLHENKLV